jgi:hypothetical protein
MARFQRARRRDESRRQPAFQVLIRRENELGLVLVTLDDDRQVLEIRQSLGDDIVTYAARARLGSDPFEPLVEWRPGVSCRRRRLPCTEYCDRDHER